MPNKCDLCTEFRYYFDKDIIKHMQEVHNEVFKKYKCDLCDKIFVNNQSLRRHRDQVHEGIKPNHMCSFCGQVFSNAGYMKIHIENVHEGIKYPCDQCDKICSTKMLLKRHVQKVHEKLANFICELCSKTFIEKFFFTRHMNEAHYNTTDFECDKCDYKGKRIENFRKHYERVHLKERNHACHICSKSFFERRTLKEHLATHTDNKIEYSVRCDICGKKVKKNYLKNHHFSLHPTEENLRSVDANCHKCLEKFPNAEKLNEHVVTCTTVNKILKCDICNSLSKQWFSSIALRKHIAESHGLIKNMCDICGDLFENREKMQVHKRKTHDPKGKVYFQSWKKWAESQHEDANNSP